MKNRHLEEYSKSFDLIDGWCSRGLFDVFDVFANEISPPGGVLEIGVHHGKFFILLNHLVEEGQRSFVVDIFDDQSLNIDYSGCGSLDIFKRNLKNFDRHQGVNVKIISGDSTDPALRLVEEVGYGEMRFISIDGGHTVEHTVHDLTLAQQLIRNDGVVILDDILNPNWLGVIEGACSFLNARPALIPFCIGHNKLFLCKLSYHKIYYDMLRGSALRKELVDFYGHSLVVI